MAAPIADAAYFLAGDSFPRQPHVEAALRGRLHRCFRSWTGQRAILERAGASIVTTDLDQRIAQLRQWIGDRRAAQRSVLLGRSSGARVATRFAAHFGAAAVICLGYPFRAPHRCIEPARFAHLADLAVPTLIIQGLRDPYGGADITLDYALSAAVSVAFVPCDHEFHLDAAAWDRIAARCSAFCQQALAQAPPARACFDEAYYLTAHPDVASALAAGRFASGAEHYERHGRREGRSFRIVPPAD